MKKGKIPFLGAVFVSALLTVPKLAFPQPGNDACADAENLCPGMLLDAHNIGASADTCSGCEDDPTSWNNCYDPNNTVWFSFTTNANGGNAIVQVELGNCLSGSSKGDALQGVVLEAGTACDGSSYNEVSNCVQNGTGSFGLNATGLAPNTEYYVQIGGAMNGNASAAAECNFSLSASGPAVRFAADTNIVHKDCQGADGEIELDNVSGGTAPYEFSLNGGAFQASGSFSGLDAGEHTVSVRDDNGCEWDFSPLRIEELNGPVIDTALIDSATCTGADGEIELDGITGGNPAYEFELNGNITQTDSLFTNVPAGMHDVIVSDQSGCSDTLNDIAVPNENGIHFAQEDSEISDCGMDNGEAWVDSIAGGTPPHSFQWDDPSAQTDCVATNLAPGTYQVSITDDNGCEFVINNVGVGEVPPDTADLSLLVDKNPICSGEEVNFNADLVNGGGSPTYEWFVNGSSVQSGANSSYNSSGLSDGDEVRVAVYPNDPCIHPDTISSRIISMAVAAPVNTTLDMDAQPSSACEGENVNIMLDANDAGPAPSFRCSKNGTQFYSGPEDTLTHNAFSDGDLLTCEVIPDHPCGDTVIAGPIPIDITPFDPGVQPRQSTIFQGESVDIRASGGTDYAWSPASSLSSSSSPSTTASPSSTTTYDIEVSKGNCDSILNAVVNVETPIAPPNTITPNGDGKNDEWRIPGIERFPEAEVIVYSRWGQKVFQSIGYGPQQRWDGKSGGSKVPAGTYYYVIELNRDEALLNDENDDVFTGSLTILY